MPSAFSVRHAGALSGSRLASRAESQFNQEEFQVLPFRQPAVCFCYILDSGGGGRNVIDIIRMQQGPLKVEDELQQSL